MPIALVMIFKTLWSVVVARLVKMAMSFITGEMIEWIVWEGASKLVKNRKSDWDDKLGERLRSEREKSRETK